MKWAKIGVSQSGVHESVLYPSVYIVQKVISRCCWLLPMFWRSFRLCLLYFFDGYLDIIPVTFQELSEHYTSKFSRDIWWGNHPRCSKSFWAHNLYTSRVHIDLKNAKRICVQVEVWLRYQHCSILFPIKSYFSNTLKVSNSILKLISNEDFH
jgi:hypothetical protein